MNSTELEILVQSAIEGIKQHQLGEDDLVESKAEWPEPALKILTLVQSSSEET
ncbi:hypothetical protein ABIE37_000344 [Arthrobacter bambusae]|uniref:Uncharacterized protein n=1 Tax=Arthrobacter bambusae TaxID=1338426 RepID=A0ABV2P1S2_9MICC